MRRRRRMIKHLWRNHRLILEGRRARTTCQVLDERMLDCDAVTALGELHLTMLQRGINDEDSLEHLLAEATKQHESLCPHCFNGVPLPEPPLSRPMATSPGRIASNGFGVTIEERAARQHLRIDTPGGAL